MAGHGQKSSSLSSGEVSRLWEEPTEASRDNQASCRRNRRHLWRRGCQRVGTGLLACALNHIALRHIEVNNCGIRGQKTNLWRRRQCSDLRRIAIEKLQTFEAERVQVVINIFGEVGAHLGLVESQAWRPLAGDLVEAGGLKSVVAGLLKDCRQVFRP